MSEAIQLTFPFKSLDFPGRSVLTVDDICRKLRMSVPHVINLVDQGELTGINTSASTMKRRNYRIPLESYRDFVIRRISGPGRKEFLEGLPRESLEEVFKQIKELLAA